MKLLRNAAGLLCAAGLLFATACSVPAEPNSPQEIDLTPISEEGTVTPPFWVVEDKQTGAQVFLLGSMHAGAADTSYPKYVMDAYRNSSYIAPELDTVAFSGNTGLVSECVGYLRQDGVSAAELIPEHESVVEYFKSLGIYDEGLEFMTPFYWTSVFSSAVLSGTGLQSQYGTESMFLTMAHRDRKEIREIEGAAAQYKMMGSVPMSVQTELISECVGDEQLHQQEESTMELFRAWCNFDDDYFRGLEVYDPEQVTNADDWNTYYNMMYTDRQKRMSEFVVNALENGDLAFVFVGAMHFYAEPSIIDFLGEAGYTVSPIRPENQADKSVDAAA